MAKLERDRKIGKVDITEEEIREVIGDLFKPIWSRISKIAAELVFNALDESWIDIDDANGKCRLVLGFLDKKGNPVVYTFNIMDLFHDSEEDPKYGEVDAVKVLRNLADALEKKRRPL